MKSFQVQEFKIKYLGMQVSIYLALQFKQIFCSFAVLLVILDWIFSCCSAIGRGTHVRIAVLDYSRTSFLKLVLALGKEGA